MRVARGWSRLGGQAGGSRGPPVAFEEREGSKQEQSTKYLQRLLRTAVLSSTLGGIGALGMGWPQWGEPDGGVPRERERVRDKKDCRSRSKARPTIWRGCC